MTITKINTTAITTPTMIHVTVVCDKFRDTEFSDVY